MAGKSLKDSAKSNSTAMGDPVSLEAETSDSSPTEQDRANSSSTSRPTGGDEGSDSGSGQKSLKEVAKEDLNEAKKGNRSMLGDPVSLKAETTEKDPAGDDNIGELTDNMKRDSKL
jgi:hypothetical protein